MKFFKVRVLPVLLVVLFICFCGGDDEAEPFTAKGVVYLDNEPANRVDVEFSVKSAGNYAEDPWDEKVKTTGTDGAYEFTTTDLGFACRLRTKHPVTNEWDRAYVDYDEGDGKTKSGAVWTHDFYLTSQ